MKKAKITAEGNFSQPSLKYHSFAKVFLVSLIIHLMWEERQDFEINIVFDVLFYERKDCPLKGDSKATINSLSSYKCLDTLKNTFVERSTQYTSFSSRKQPANAGSERKQFTENDSKAIQQTILTHEQTKCPPVSSHACYNCRISRVDDGAPWTKPCTLH